MLKPKLADFSLVECSCLVYNTCCAVEFELHKYI